MSEQWGTGDRAERILRRNRRILADGGCTFCRPNRGENMRSPHGKYVHKHGKIVFRPSKGKDRK